MVLALHRAFPLDLSEDAELYSLCISVVLLLIKALFLALGEAHLVAKLSPDSRC